VSTYFSAAVITMSEQVVLSAVAQRIVVTFVTNEHVKPADILKRLRGHFGDETHSRLHHQRTINATYYSKLLEDRVKPAFRSKRRGRSVKSFCLFHVNARPHIAALTTGTLEEMHYEVLPHLSYSPDLAPSDFHLFGALRERP
jgi:hypothetical protein